MKRTEASKLCREYLKQPYSEELENLDLIKDLDLDSLDKVDFIMWFEDEFEIEVPDDTEKNFRTLNNFLDLLEKK